MNHLSRYLFTGLLVFSFCQPVPVTQRQQLQLIPQGQLYALSFESYQEVRQQIPTQSGTPEAAMVKQVGDRIRAGTELYLKRNNDMERLKGFQWEFTLFEDSSINAWAMPGGKVGVFTGILPITRDETGLAVVMGHEIAHAVAGHGNERMSQMLLVQLGGIALQQALKSNRDETRELALAAFGVGAQVGLLLPYSRVHETEADQLGLIFMAMAGYDPRASVDFWNRMAEARKGGEPPEFLSTHPSDRARIRNLEKMMPKALEYYKQMERAELSPE